MHMYLSTQSNYFNLLNVKLNPICHLLALLGAHHILHVSGKRVKVIFMAQRDSML
jgi:hypothetical protein